MKECLSGAAFGAALCYGLFGDLWFATLAITLACSSLAFKVEDSIREQD